MSMHFLVILLAVCNNDKINVFSATQRGVRAFLSS